MAYISPEHAARTPRPSRFVDGPPVLAVEILSPSDQHEDIAEKVRLYLDSGVFLVWVVDTEFGTVTVHRPDASPSCSTPRRKSTPTHLPGFRVPVARFFD